MEINEIVIEKTKTRKKDNIIITPTKLYCTKFNEDSKKKSSEIIINRKDINGAEFSKKIDFTYLLIAISLIIATLITFYLIFNPEHYWYYAGILIFEIILMCLSVAFLKSYINLTIYFNGNKVNLSLKIEFDEIQKIIDILFNNRKI